VTLAWTAWVVVFGVMCGLSIIGAQQASDRFVRYLAVGFCCMQTAAIFASLYEEPSDQGFQIRVPPWFAAAVCTGVLAMCVGLTFTIYGAYVLATSSTKRRWELVKGCFVHEAKLGGLMGRFLAGRGYTTLLGLPVQACAPVWTPTAPLAMASLTKAPECDSTDVEDSSDSEKCSSEQE
jgi:hypothetical protein